MALMVDSAPTSVLQEGYLLDALLQSCQKSALNPPLPSFGRQLKPYFDLDSKEKLKIQPAKKAAKAKVAPPPVVKAAIDSAKATKLPQKKAQLAAAPKPKSTPAVDPFAWAGPGFCVAPPPEQLPTPTSFLLG